MYTKILNLLEHRHVSGVSDVYCCHLLLLFVTTTSLSHKDSVLKCWCHFLVIFVINFQQALTVEKTVK
jgi:hypothetical protein